MDPDSPASRMERTFWTVWYYITGAVNRFLRPEPTVINDPKTVQESAVDSEPADFGHAEGDASGRGADEQQPLTTASLLSSSQPLVAWELCTTDIDLGPDEESTRNETPPSRGCESEASEEVEDVGEEQRGQTGNDEDGLFVAKEDEQERNGHRELCTRGRDETPDNGVYEATTSSLRLTGDAMSEDVEESERKAGAEDSESAMAHEEKNDETMRNIQADDTTQREGEQDLQAGDIEVKLSLMSLEEEDNVRIAEAKVQRNEADAAAMHEEVENSGGVPQLASENENKSDDEGEKQVDHRLSVREELSDDDRDFEEDPDFPALHVELQRADDKSGMVSEDELIVVEREQVMTHGRESDEVEDVEEEEDEKAVEDREQGAVIEEEKVNEAANNQTIEEVNIKIATEDSQEEDILTEHVAFSEEVVQNAKAELHTTEFADGDQEDVAKDTKVQPRTRETDDNEMESTVIDDKSHISVDESFFNKVQEASLSGEVEESYVEIPCTTASVTVKHEGETGQEMRGEFKNIPPGICEGRVVVSQELNFPTFEETQEGVPEYNNEPGPDENATQRLLEEGDCEEIQGSPLPEEVGSKEPESAENSGCSTGADYLLVRERMAEEQESTQDIKTSFGAGLPQETERPQESGHLFEEEEGELVVDSMKTGIEHSENKFESGTVLTDEEAKKPQDGTEEVLVEIEMDEGLCDAAVDGSETTGAVPAEEVLGFTDEIFRDAELQKMMETSFFQESVDATNSEQSDDVTPCLLEDITVSAFLKQSDEPKLFDVEMQDAGLDMEETGYGVEEETAAAEDEMQNKNEMQILHPQVMGMAEFESPETKSQPSDEALKEMLTEAAGESKTAESKPKYLTLVSTEEVAKHETESERSGAEETVSSVSGRQDVIDEEILDLWIQAALSEDTDGMKQEEGPEPGQQTEPSNEERDEISSVQTEADKEKLVESNSRESEFVSGTEMSSSGFLDQSLSEWGALNDKTQLLESTNTRSFQGINDMLENMSESADISELSEQPNSEFLQDVLMQDAAETERSYLKEEESITEMGFHSDSGITSPHLNQESDKSAKERVESAESETGLQKEIEVTAGEDGEEADAKTEMITLHEVKKTKDDPLEITASDSPDEIKRTESGQSRSGSEASLEEEITSTESDSQGDTTSAESERKLPSLDKPQPGWSEVIAESLPEVAEWLATKDQEEMDEFALDFTVQRSRIAVKNPRVRPPTDPRSLLHMPSVDPTPSPRLAAKVPAGVPLGGLGIGIKLPGLGAGFPVLKKTQQVVRDENSPDTDSQETKPEKSDAPKQDETRHKPRWMPPRQIGFGNPLMSELKTKLKKTTKE